ncbi:uncharacterized protein LOC124932119 [Impatiens glandulifera]|uniref:uncharacterized protein LOC124932119 n=1 Tax=Impatiens glandulifera TaxID=253017 RepID=UPI001FB0972D|nr:uncharacterized protein LOC124932119 [Impatiens glandulifera]
MEQSDNVLNTILEEDNFEEDDDVEMLDVEEGELIETDTYNRSDLLHNNVDLDLNTTDQNSGIKTSKNKRKKKKKNKRKRCNSTGDVTDVNRFVLDICKRLKEKKSYLMYNAVGVLGASALDDLVKEVDAIQACGGQKTADGKRFRFGGGILWNILKVRDPNAYKEIMRRGKEFEKQFRQQTDQMTLSSSDHSIEQANNDQSQIKPPLVEAKKRVSALDRLRVPVSYNDLPGEEDQKDEKTPDLG